VLRPGPTEEVIAEMNMGGSVYSSAVPANGVLYIASHNQLFALEEQDGATGGARNSLWGNPRERRER